VCGCTTKTDILAVKKVGCIMAKKKRKEYKEFVKKHRKCPLSPSIRGSKLFYQCVALSSGCKNTGNIEKVFE
jgi:hypothetical protein